MDRILIFSGIWLAFLPNIKWNILMTKKGKITFAFAGLFYISGIFSIMLGLNAVVDVIHDTKVFMILLNVILMLLVALAIVVKLKVENGILARMAGIVGGLFLIASLYIVASDLKEAASSCIALTGGLILLASPLDAITKKTAYK